VFKSVARNNLLNQEIIVIVTTATQGNEMSKSTILRQLTMLRLIPKSPSFILSKQLHQTLYEEGFSVSKRTIERDLDNLASLVGIDFTTSPEGFKWAYIKTAHEFTPALAPSEALLLCIAYRQIIDVLPFNCISDIEPKFLKAEQTLARNEKFKNWHERVKIITFGLPLKAKPIDDEIRCIVYETVLNTEKLVIKYQKEDETVDYTLNTHGLIIREHTHYLVATKIESPDIFQLFKLSRIKRAIRSYEDNLNCKSDIKAYLNSNVSGYLLSNDPIKLELLATGPALAMFKEANLAEDQTLTIIEKSPQNIATVTATVEFTHELIHFLLGFGKWVRVTSPNSVIEAIQDRHGASVLLDYT
jgi:predicted DNA-binding transcriptional regulator YafY